MDEDYEVQKKPDDAVEEVRILDLSPVKKSCMKRAISYTIEGGSVTNSSRKSVSFASVTAYYFPREQGFTCVPSQGGCTLGMALRHSHVEELTLDELTAWKKVEHERVLLTQQKKRNRKKIKPIPISEVAAVENLDEGPSVPKLDWDIYPSLQPVSMRQRRTLLKESGIRKIKTCEKDDCREIRSSREACGCTCQAVCNPDVCFCSLAGIKCQVDRANFPCSCTSTECGNPNGRVEFDPVKVQNHFTETVARLSQTENLSHLDVWNAPDAWSCDWNNIWTEESRYHGESSTPDESSRNSSFEEEAVPSIGSLVKETIVSCAN